MWVILAKTNVYQKLRIADHNHKLWVKYNQSVYYSDPLPYISLWLDREREWVSEWMIEWEVLSSCDLWVRLHYYCSSECQVVRKLEKFLHIVNQHLPRIRLDYRNGKRHLCTIPHRRILFLKQVNSFNLIICLLFIYFLW